MITSNVQRWSPQVYAAVHALEALDPERTAVAMNRVNLSTTELVQVILAIIQWESSGNPNANGDNGCSYGLMQINWCAWTYPGGDRSDLYYAGDRGDGTVALIGVRSAVELFDPEINIGLGVRYFLKQLATFEDVPLAIEGYNNPTRAYFNQAYLDGVLRILEVTAGYFAELKKKSVAEASCYSWPGSSRPSGLPSGRIPDVGKTHRTGGTVHHG